MRILANFTAPRNVPKGDFHVGPFQGSPWDRRHPLRSKSGFDRAGQGIPQGTLGKFFQGRVGKLF